MGGNMRTIKEFQERTNYQFVNESILVEALTHSSFANEKKGKRIHHNERLEFLGDAVLSIVVSDYLFDKYEGLAEGDLTKIRARVVCETTLGDVAKKFDLGNFIRFGRGEEMTGGRQRISILSDAFEAVIAALYLDGGIEVARTFIMHHLMEKIELAMQGKVFLDYKTRLQERVQMNKANRIRYEVVGESGPDHCKTFTMCVKLNDEIIGVGEGRSKKEAEQQAAKEGIVKLDE